jgi:F-type H+-transporting ATPase subunit gamma
LPNLKDIRRRIRSVRSTQQITRAMKMVAAAKLRKAQDRLHATDAYVRGLDDLRRGLVRRAGPGAHPFLRRPEGDRALVLLITGDRGLCGSYNSALLARADRLAAERGGGLSFLLAGKKGVDHFAKTPVEVLAAYPNIFAKLDALPSAEMAEAAREAFLSGRVQRVEALSARFRSLSSFPVELTPLLPMEAGEAGEEGANEYLCEPSIGEILAELLPRALSVAVHRLMLEANAAEQAARMTAMELATHNADDMIGSLTLFYNRARQAAITKELIEIVSGAQAQ